MSNPTDLSGFDFQNWLEIPKNTKIKQAEKFAVSP